MKTNTKIQQYYENLMQQTGKGCVKKKPNRFTFLSSLVSAVDREAPIKDILFQLEKKGVFYFHYYCQDYNREAAKQILFLVARPLRPLARPPPRLSRRHL